jgi:hypothetical protein
MTTIFLPFTALLLILVPFSSSYPESPKSSFPQTISRKSETSQSDHSQVYPQLARKSGKNNPAQDPSSKNYETLTPEEKERLDRNYREWKSLPPERQKLLERRMEKWKDLSPEEKALYRRRMDQWQSLPPQERHRMRERLDNWDRLPQKEKDQIRRRFSAPGEEN